MSSSCPSLVSLCQRVAANNLDSISGFGDISFDVLGPILSYCSAEQLERLEQSTPHIQAQTPDLWKAMCLRSHPLEADKYERGEMEEPQSWRDHYFHLSELQQARLEKLSARMRSQRQKADEQRKEREIKITDDLPPMKRSRFNDWTSQPKSLFQKTRSEVSRLQRNAYSLQRPPMLANGKRLRVLATPSSAMKLPPQRSSASSDVKSSGVTVSTITIRHPLSITKSPPSLPVDLSAPSDTPKPVPQTSMIPPMPSPPKSRFVKANKKDPMASLFMPKHRAHSQRTN